MTIKIEGIIPAMVTPMRADEERARTFRHGQSG